MTTNRRDAAAMLRAAFAGDPPPEPETEDHSEYEWVDAGLRLKECTCPGDGGTLAELADRMRRDLAGVECPRHPSRKLERESRAPATSDERRRAARDAVGRALTMPLNSSADDMARAAGFPDASHTTSVDPPLDAA